MRVDSGGKGEMWVANIWLRSIYLLVLTVSVSGGWCLYRVSIQKICILSIPRVCVFHVILILKQRLFALNSINWSALFNAEVISLLWGGQWTWDCHGGYLGSIPLRLLWDTWWAKCLWFRLFSAYCGFLPSVTFRHCSMLAFILTLLLPEGQGGDAWERSRLFNSVSYVFLLLCLCILIVCMLCSVYSVFFVPTGILRLRWLR